MRFGTAGRIHCGDCIVGKASHFFAFVAFARNQCNKGRRACNEFGTECCSRVCHLLLPFFVYYIQLYRIFRKSQGESIDDVLNAWIVG